MARYFKDENDADDFEPVWDKPRQKESWQQWKKENDAEGEDMKSNPADKDIPKKEKKPKKIFIIGDVLTLKKTKQGNLPDDAYDFLMTYGRFDVIDVNENGNLYLGFDRNGERFFFNSNRFELRVPNKEEENFFENEMDDF